MAKLRYLFVHVVLQVLLANFFEVIGFEFEILEEEHSLITDKVLHLQEKVSFSSNGTENPIFVFFFLQTILINRYSFK